MGSSLRSSLKEYVPLVVGAWWAVGIGVFAAVIGLLLDIKTDLKVPAWLWIAVLVLGVSVAQFLAFHKVRQERDHFRETTRRSSPQEQAKQGFKTAFHRYQVEWTAERDSQPSGIEEGQQILDGLGARLADLHASVKNEAQPAILDEIAHVLREIKALQQHQLFIDGGRSYREFWERGDAVLKRAESVMPSLQMQDPDAFRRGALEAVGFRGFVTVRELREGRIDDVPREPGVYVVLRERDDPPILLPTSPAGWFKGKNPTVHVSALEAAWVPGAHVLYIGKTSQREGLRARLKDLIDFGAGKPVGHWGGRYLWQIVDSSEFVVAWRASPPGAEPRDEESKLLRSFSDEYGGRLPFANLRR